MKRTWSPFIRMVLLFTLTEGLWSRALVLSNQPFSVSDQCFKNWYVLAESDDLSPSPLLLLSLCSPGVLIGDWGVKGQKQMPSVAGPGWRGWWRQGPGLLPAANSSEPCHVPPTQMSAVICSEATEASRLMLHFQWESGWLSLEKRK